MSITLDSKVPAGPLADKWQNFIANEKLVNPANKRKYEVIVVGGGISGLAAAQAASERAPEVPGGLEVVVLEKGSEVGAHILSGAVLEPRAMNELFPNWKEMGAPQSPTDEQYAELESQGKLQTLSSPRSIAVDNGETTISFSLPRAGVSLLITSLSHH